ncbi:MAG TPA: glycosyltransferase [Bacteroidales bacterium]|nr:glycosyltransferase [Bacteroidales bacterium]HPT11691.1 glycosyltransferase [Bacteroidales bacterium]
MLLIMIMLALLTYSVFICRLIFVLKSTVKRESSLIESRAKTTFISVVVACKNEANNIIHLLDSLVKQDYPSENFEVIIVDDNSTDQTAGVTDEFIRHHPGNIRLIVNCSDGKKSAILNGVKESAGELIIVTDADCIVSPGWISSYEWLYLKESPDMIAGRVICNNGEGFASAFGKYEFAALQGVTEALTIAGNPVMCNGANMAFARDKYLAHADRLRMEISSGDDVFLLHAIKKAGGKICWNGAAEAAVRTDGATTLAGLLRQRARWASKATHYTDAATILTAITVFAANVALLFLYAGSFFSTVFLYLLPVAFVIKAIPDGIIIKQTLIQEKERFSPLLFIIMDIFYPLYFILVFILSFFPSLKKFSGR